MSTGSKIRLDELVTQRGLASDTAAAARLLIAGGLASAELTSLKPGDLVAPDVELHFKDSASQYVSRGGDKLAAALDGFAIAVDGARCLDIGASTGGFTDCLLQHGAASVTAVDVAYGQFAWSLRQDARVCLIERTNIRALPLPAPADAFDLVVVDLSFTSTSRLFGHLVGFLKPQGQLLVLVKPQFEAGPGLDVIIDSATHSAVLKTVLDRSEAAGLVPRGLLPSPLKGPKGNIEFLFWASRMGKAATIEVGQVVMTAHKRLD